MYVAEWGNGRVQRMNRSGDSIQMFGEENLKAPSCLNIANKYVYVSDSSSYSIVLYETSGIIRNTWSECRRV